MFFFFNIECHNLASHSCAGDCQSFLYCYNFSVSAIEIEHGRDPFKTKTRSLSPLLKTLQLLPASITRIKPGHLTMPYLLTSSPCMIWLQFPVYFLCLVPLLTAFQPHLPSCVTCMQALPCLKAFCICPSLSPAALHLDFPRGGFFWTVINIHIFMEVFPK